MSDTDNNGNDRSKILSDNIDAPLWMFWKRRRYVVVIMAFFGFFNVYSLRVNLSIAIVAMTELKNITLENGTTIQEREFDWDSKTQGLVLSSFFYGYICTQFLGGYVATKLGGNYVFGLGIGITAVFTLFTPLAAKLNVYVLLTIRIIEGLFEGVTFPCIHAVWSKWAPPHERSRMATIAFAGNYAGTVISMPICGLLADYYGWESLFYVFGVIGCIWFTSWMYLIKEKPEMDPFITEGEKAYIVDSLVNKKGQKHVVHPPWKAIALSPAVWAISAAQFAELWGFYTMLTQLPTFLKDTMSFNLQKTGFISALPYLAMGTMLGIAGYIADLCQVKGFLTTTQVRRYFNCTAFLAQTIFMFLAVYILQPSVTVTCITIAIGLGAFAWCGFAVNHLDIAPQFAGILMGITNTWGTIPGIVSPLLTGFIVQNGSASEWRVVFYIAAAIYLVGAVIYWFFASGEIQSWAITDDADPEENEKTEGDQNFNMKGYDNNVKIQDES